MSARRTTRQNAEFILSLFKKFGWDAHIETFNVLYPTPVSETVELLGPKPFKATLQEPNIPGDTTRDRKQPALPAYLAYQGDGDVNAPLVYVNYGMQDDYKTLRAAWRRCQRQDRHRALWRRLARAEAAAGAAAWRGRLPDLFRSVR